MRRALLPLLLLLPGGLPALAHQGPPFPVLVDQRAGPYVASVWTDPDIGVGTFFVVLEAPKGRGLPAKTSVRIGVQPVSKRLPEVFYDAELQPVDEGARYLAKVPFDKGEMWHVRVVLGGSKGGGELATEVEATPDGILGPLGSLVYAFPFLAVGFLWIKAVLRRRAAPAGKECEGA
ncbi:MAG: hypothetical protein ACJ76N_24020 [Thermoanaerobaculia bacterium]